LIIDGHVHIEEKATVRPPFTVESLIQHMDEKVLANGGRIKYAVVQGPTPRDPKGFDYQKQHDYLIQSIGKYPDRLFGMMYINPLMDVEQALTVLEGLVSKGIKAVKLHPRISVFRPDSNAKQIAPILEKCAKLKLHVHIHSGDPFSEPSRIEPLAESFPDLPIVICHFGSQMISYALDAIGVAKRRKNVLLELNSYPMERLREGVKTVGPAQFIFGSDCPINDIWSWVNSIEVLKKPAPLGVGLSEQETEMILGGNLARLLNVH
jgi:predicted TIM-barrel fold metal-dependent hydrolase